MRVKNPLPAMTDGEVLRAAARKLEALALRMPKCVVRQENIQTAARLRVIARRVPLWTNR